VGQEVCSTDICWANAVMVIAAKRRKHLARSEILRLLGDIANQPQEHFVVMTFDGGGRLINRHLVYIGTIDRIEIHMRDVFAKAIPDFPAAIIVSHSHPSGDPSPSKDDISTTQQLLAAGQLLQIPVIDHIIVAGDRHYSFVANGLIFPELKP